MILRNCMDPAENGDARRKLSRLMAEGHLPGGSGLGALTLIFEIATAAEALAPRND